MPYLCRLVGYAGFALFDGSYLESLFVPLFFITSVIFVLFFLATFVWFFARGQLKRLGSAWSMVGCGLGLGIASTAVFPCNSSHFVAHDALWLILMSLYLCFFVSVIWKSAKV